MPLQIFEPRYMSMLTECLKQDSGFGVLLIREGREVGEVPQVFPVGVYAHIEDWHQQENGLLGIKVRGGRKFRVLKTFSGDDQGMSAEVLFLPEEPVLEIGEQYMDLLGLLSQLQEHPAVQALALPAVKDASQLGWQLTQLLPLSRPDKVALLELDNPEERLDQLTERIDRLAEGEG